MIRAKVSSQACRSNVRNPAHCLILRIARSDDVRRELVKRTVRLVGTIKEASVLAGTVPHCLLASKQGSCSQDDWADWGQGRPKTCVLGYCMQPHVIVRAYSGRSASQQCPLTAIWGSMIRHVVGIGMELRHQWESKHVVRAEASHDPVSQQLPCACAYRLLCLA